MNSSLSAFEMAVDREVDTCGLKCPLPILRAKRTLNEMVSGQKLRIIATDPGSVGDFQSFARQSGNALLVFSEKMDGIFGFVLQRK